MTVRDAQRAIEPGSVAQGDRAALEQGLSQVLGQAPQGGGGDAPAGPGPLAIPEDPLGALLSGEVSGEPGVPVTDGLSVGPGQGPAQSQDIMMGDRASKLRMLATEASSPNIRAAARDELRRMARTAV